MAVKVAIIYYSATGTTYRTCFACPFFYRPCQSRYGLPTAQLKQFLDTTGPLWAKGALLNKICSAFTSSGTAHGGQETTIVNVNTTFYHWGAIIVGPGYADPIQFKAGNPYGASFTSNNGALEPDETALASARFQGRRVAELAAQFNAGRKKA
jgi:NAD(P)H dehydrogenase (quinone)